MVKIDSNFQTAFESYLGSKALDEKTKGKYLFYYHKFINLYPDLNQKNVDIFLENNSNSQARAMIKNLISSVKRWEFPDDTKKEIGFLDIPSRSGKQKHKIPKFMKKSDLDILNLKIYTGDSFKDEELKLMILVQFYAGIRLNELINLSFNDLNFEKNKEKKDDAFQTIKISSESAKFGTEREAFLPTEVYRRLIKWHLKDLKINHSNKSYDNSKPIWNIKISRYKELFNKFTLELLGETYNTHSLRHGRGHNLMVDEGEPIEMIKQYLGHADIRSTQIYANLDNTEIKRRLEMKNRNISVIGGDNKKIKDELEKGLD